MQFIVDIRPSLPAEWSKEHLTAMLQRETDAAIELMERGVLVRIDRVVGRGGNISVWETDSLEALDRALTGLPLAPWLQFDVTPVVKHRVQIAYEAHLKAKAAR